MFRTAVLNHRTDLQQMGFPVPVLPAMGAWESGAWSSGDWRNSNKQAGVMQIRDSQGNPSKKSYDDTPDGYYENVSDAIAKMNDGFSGMKGWEFDCLATATKDGGCGYPNVPKVVAVVKHVLYYNAGYDWIHALRGSINEKYLEDVAKMFDKAVPKYFPSYSDSTFHDPLLSGQAIVDACVLERKCGE